MTETDYDRAWRERGEAEAALRQWRNNQSSPGMLIGIATFAGFMGLLMLCLVIRDRQWIGLFFVVPFLGLAVLTPWRIRDERRAREEAEVTLKRLGVWK